MGDTMSGGLVLGGATSGSVELKAPAVAGTNTITLPATTGTVITNADTGSVTNAMLAGSISNDKLANSTITIGGQSVALGGSIGGVGATGAVFNAQRTTRDGVSLGLQRVTTGTGLTDTNNSFNSGNWRFTPNVAGYYFIVAKFGPVTAAARGITQHTICVYKNGAAAIGTPSINSEANVVSVEGYVLMNGSTDYLDLYVNFANPSNPGGVYKWPDIQWHGHMVRAA